MQTVVVFIDVVTVGAEAQLGIPDVITWAPPPAPLIVAMPLFEIVIAPPEGVTRDARARRERRPLDPVVPGVGFEDFIRAGEGQTCDRASRRCRRATAPRSPSRPTPPPPPPGPEIVTSTRPAPPVVSDIQRDISARDEIDRTAWSRQACRC